MLNLLARLFEEKNIQLVDDQEIVRKAEEIIGVNDKQLVDYALRAGRLDAILNELTREYCRDRCEFIPTGCCQRNYHNLFGAEEMTPYQEKEARMNGWQLDESQQCKYHSADKGCNLTLLKPPLCLGYLCLDLVRHLEQTFGRRTTRPFIKSMSDIKQEPLIYFPILLPQMKLAEQHGKELLAIKRSRLRFKW